MSVDVPSGWEYSTLGEVCQIRARIGWRGLSADEYVEEGPFLIAGKHIVGSRVLWSMCDHLPEWRYEESSEIQLKSGDVVLSKDGTIGRRALIDFLPGKSTINGTMMLMRPNSKKLESGFLFQHLGGFHFRELVNERISGGAIPHIFQRDMINLPILLPPLSEQRRIAEILSCVDDAIAATQAVIDQTRTVKQGVLKCLLTKGIGHTRFKQTEIGEIPEEWEVQTLEALLANVDTPMRSGPFGSALKKCELVDTGMPFLGIDNVHVERFARDYKRFVSLEKFQQLRRFAVKPRDVMITIMGTVGRCCVVPEDIGDALSSKHIWTMTFDTDRYLPELVCWQLNYAPWVLKEFMRTTQGGVMGAINSAILKKLLFPVPPITEQRVILNALTSFSESLMAGKERIERLSTTKSALMSDLLTGRKRVSVAEQDVAAAE